MIVYKNLTLIGSSHIAIESIKEIKSVVERGDIEFVAIELDRGRLLSLMSNAKRKLRVKDVLKLGVGGFLFNLVGAWVEEQLGKVVRVKPGSDMKQAVISAGKMKCKVVLIDQEIKITIKNLMKGITFREKLRFVGDIIKGAVFKKSDLGKIEDLQKIDLRKVPPQELIDKLVENVAKRYPSVYKALIEDRNKVMARKLIKLMSTYPDSKIVAIVGAGHVSGMMNLISQQYK